MCQLTFDEITKNPTEKNPVEQETVETFACCSSYRKCSELKECLFNDDAHKGCLYRKNLEKGHIFYGKNANCFDKKQYSKIMNSFNSLNNEQQATAIRVIKFAIEGMTASGCLFCEYDRELFNLVTRSDTAPLGFTYSNNIDDYTKYLTVIDLRKIVADCKESLRFNRRDKALEAFKKRKSLSEAVLNNFIYLTINKDFVKYYIELYYDVYENLPNIVPLSMRGELV